jgi:hypothetical protein
VPSSVNVLYYSGVNAPNLLASKTQYNAYYAISATGGTGYSYGISLISDSATFGNVSGTNASKMARYTGTTWNIISNSSANGSTGTMQTTANNQNVFGNFTGTDFLNNPLPVELLSFNANKINEDVLLTWSTSSEKNNKGFMVEKSSDGISFTNIGFVKGAFNTTKLQNYKHSDLNAFESSNTLYYRLKQLDLDGQYTYSSVVLVNKESNELNQLRVFPNPFTANFQIAINGAKNEKVSIETFDIQGKLVNSQRINLTENGLNLLNTNNLEALQGGVYFVNITSNGVSEVIKMVKN